MKARAYTLLLQPIFLISLALFLLNDFYLKYEFHNEFTGKLSDFAGLFVFAIWLFVLFPAYKKRVIIFCTIFFCWWKSPLSNSFIYFFNYHLSLPLLRIVDFTDLFALLVLPLAYRIKAPGYSTSFIRSVAIYTICIISFFSFCATSLPRYISHDEVYMNKSFRTRLPAEAIIEKFREKSVPIERDTAYYRKLSGYDKYLKIKDSSGEQKIIRLADNKEMELYERSVPYMPTYTIPDLVINNDTIRMVRFSIDEMYNGKKRIITLISFEYDTAADKGYYPSPI